MPETTEHSHRPYSSNRHRRRSSCVSTYYWAGGRWIAAYNTKMNGIWRAYDKQQGMGWWCGGWGIEKHRIAKISIAIGAVWIVTHSAAHTHHSFTRCCLWCAAMHKIEQRARFLIFFFSNILFFLLSKVLDLHSCRFARWYTEIVESNNKCCLGAVCLHVTWSHDDFFAPKKLASFSCCLRLKWMDMPTHGVWKWTWTWTDILLWDVSNKNIASYEWTHERYSYPPYCLAMFIVQRRAYR